MIVSPDVCGAHKCKVTSNKRILHIVVQVAFTFLYNAFIYVHKYLSTRIRLHVQGGTRRYNGFVMARIALKTANLPCTSYYASVCTVHLIHGHLHGMTADTICRGISIPRDMCAMVHEFSYFFLSLPIC